jgi:diadenosine tetraphosphatase ApaH/serine/threonine PP2A family protein phosphatase
MRYAILADIHANLQAFEAVLEDMKKQSCTHAVCLGDIVGYNANPKECLDIIRGMNIPCVKGNHDEYASNEEPLDGFNEKAAQAVTWTRRQLPEEDRYWLQQLPLSLVVEGFTIVHATLDDPDRWGYVFEPRGAATHFSHQKTPVCFFGHIHVPLAFHTAGGIEGQIYTRFRIDEGRQYFINPGSVGQPRDGNPKAAYATYDLDSGWVELRRVDYDIGGAQAARDQSGLPRPSR